MSHAAEKLKVAIIGGGNVGSALAATLIEKQIVLPEHLSIVERNEATCDDLRRRFGCYVSSSIYPAIGTCNVVILSVKPQDFSEAAVAISLVCPISPLILSLMTGIRVATIREKIPGAKRIIRCMPNLPLLVGAGVNVCFFPENCARQDLDYVEAVLSSCGQMIAVPTEDLVDTATAVSASGPGILSYLLEEYIRGAIALGFSREQAPEIVYQTISGTIDLLRAHDLTPEELRSRVATKNGTTEAALTVLSEGNVGRNIIDSLKAAFTRARELSK